MSSSNHLLNDPTIAWRAIVLYGLNTGTHKMALACCLAQFVQQGRDRVILDELAEAFLTVYEDRLVGGQPQLLTPGRLHVMERIVTRLHTGAIDRAEAVALIGQRGFRDVVPRFHTVFDGALPALFYDTLPNGSLLLTDAAFAVLGSDQAPALLEEIDARWSLLEAAFAMHREPATLATDIRAVYLARGYDRTPIARMQPILHAYQEGRCFYCGEVIAMGEGHVDHVIPRQFLMHDEAWNLVLAHGFCNAQKRDQLPSPAFIQRLSDRNEHLIASNHPLKRHIIAQLGQTQTKRAAALHRVHQDARVVIPWEWTGLPGREPGTSEFYRHIVRGLSR